MSEKEYGLVGYNNQMKIECGPELKKILLEQGINHVIDQGFEVHKYNGSMIAKFNNENKYLVGDDLNNSYREYDNFDEAVKEFLEKDK